VATEVLLGIDLTAWAGSWMAVLTLDILILYGLLTRSDEFAS